MNKIKKDKNILKPIVIKLSPDINNDEIINILDIVNLVNLVLSPSSQNNNDIFFGDINNDAILNVLDIVNLVNLVLNPN